MGVFRSYFSKNNTIVRDSLLNSSQNPVTEIVYGGEDMMLTRFIFDVDLNPLLDKIERGYINPDTIISHKLHLTNTIRYVPTQLGRTTYNKNIDRASSFVLDLFKITEDWDEGSGYDLVFTDEFKINPNETPSNWFYKKTENSWDSSGIYSSGVTETIGSKSFNKGNEDLVLDVTDYINDRLQSTGLTSTGLGIKFTDDFEVLKTKRIQSVAFHTKYTHTFFEPYIETIVNNEILDNRNDFYMDKQNLLCFYLENIKETDVITIDSVIIYDYLGEEFLTFSESGVTKLNNQTFGVQFEILSQDYPDAVIFRDEWNIRINGKEIKKTNKFYVLSFEDFYVDNKKLNFSNYSFNYSGILENEKIKRGEIRKIFVNFRELYVEKILTTPLNIEYSIYTNVDSKNRIDIIPFTPVNRIGSSYQITLDTTWFIPNDYYLEVRMVGDGFKKSKETLGFSII